MYRDEANEVGDDYNPADFVTHVLQYSKPKLTWDEDDAARTKITRHKFSKDDLKTMDFDAYLASEDDSDEDEQEDKEKMSLKYKKLLEGGDSESDAEEKNNDSEESDVQGDMEVTFAPGLSSLAQSLLDKKKQKEVRFFSATCQVTFEIGTGK